jgi:Clr5 domain
MAHMKETYSFTPSKRAYQTQFKRWGFPSKQNPAHRNVDLVTRVKELWEKNTSQRDMLKTLTEEGFNIKERELMRVRAKNRWLLRVPNGMKSHGVTEAVLPALTDQLTAASDDTPGAAGDSNDDQDLETPQPRAASPSLSPEVIKKRKERYEKLQAESDERWAAKKRRRRTRGWAGLPADPPGPPRFPSETTIDESKTYLNLDSNGYRQLRDHFQKVCEEAGVIKKTLAGPEKWQAVKDRLIQESLHLQQVFWTDNTNLETKNLALDVICTDVTKRMRTMERRMTIAEAKNILGVNPEESRHIRNAFYGTLKADHFTSKLEAGDEHWRELKEHWIKGSPLLQSILAAGESDPEYANKVKAMEVLCRDVMKRLRDDQTKRDPVRKDNETQHSAEIAQRGETANANAQPPPGPSDNHAVASSIMTGISNGISSLASKALARTPMVAGDISDLQIDPSLLQAANDPAFAARNGGVGQNFLLDIPTAPVPVYVRPHPKSQMHKGAKMWLESLHSRTVFELRQLLQAKWPDAAIVRIDGVDKDQNGQDISYLIEEDEELDAYLTHVQDRKATIVAMLNRP